MTRLGKLVGAIPPEQHFRELIKSGVFTSELEGASEDISSRGWLQRVLPGWMGRDFVRAVQLKAANLASKGISSNPIHERRRRWPGCTASETTYHILQRCGAVHGLRISRHKISKHCQKRLNAEVENEPHVRHPNGTLYKPNLAIHLPENITIIFDAQVNWEKSGTCLVIQPVGKLKMPIGPYMEEKIQEYKGVNDINNFINTIKEATNNPLKKKVDTKIFKLQYLGSLTYVRKL